MWFLHLPGTGTGNDSTAAFPATTKLLQPGVFGPSVNPACNDLLTTNLSGNDLRRDRMSYADPGIANLTGADLAGATLAGFGSSYGQATGFDGANLDGAVCGRPNYIEAYGAETAFAHDVPSGYTPPL